MEDLLNSLSEISMALEVENQGSTRTVQFHKARLHTELKAAVSFETGVLKQKAFHWGCIVPYPKAVPIIKTIVFVAG